MTASRWGAVLLLSLLLAAAPAWPASADPAACNEKAAYCEIRVNIRDPKPAPKPKATKKPAPAPKPVEKIYPQCRSFSGDYVVGAPGTFPSDLGLTGPQYDDWVHVTCIEGGDVAWAWMDPGVNAESVARSLLAQLQLEPVTIGWTPTSPDAMGVVGAPTWLWVDNPGRLSWGPATISAGNVSLTAEVESVTWAMGNGDQVRCASRGTVWRKGMGAGPSPTCGYTYVKQGTYQVRATAHWVARWHGYGRSGSIPLSLSQERTLEVGEVQVIVNG